MSDGMHLTWKDVGDGRMYVMEGCMLRWKYVL